MAFTFVTLATALAIATLANAESHTVEFDNQCGYGTPTLIQNGNVLSTGSPFTSNGDFPSAIAYLQSGSCGFNGEGCTLIEMTLGNPNPSSPGSGSSVDISLISPHAFVVPVAFSYENGCPGTGAACNSPNCNTAFFQPDQTQVQVACQADNVNLLITFCGNGAGAQSSAVKASSIKPTPTPSSKPVSAPSSSAAPINVAPTPPIAISSSAVTSNSAAAASPKPSRKSCPAASSRKRTLQSDTHAKRNHRSRSHHH